jgi:uncharacterized membrane protein YjjP (DUF1212 family)
MQKKECEIFLEDVLVLGRMLLETGADVKRVEDTIIRIFNAYGFESPQIYTVTSLIVATIKDSEGNHYTQSVSSTKSSTDLGQLEILNALSRDICKTKPSVAELDKQINNIKRSKPKPIIKCIGYMLAAGGFAIFFGGSFMDGILSALVAIAIYLMDYHFKLKNINNVLYTFTASFVSGCLAIIFVHFGIGDNIDKVMIGDIMLLIPGLLLVNSIKEMFNRDIVTGLYRFVEAMLVAIALAGGYALAIIAGGVVL